LQAEVDRVKKEERLKARNLQKSVSAEDKKTNKGKAKPARMGNQSLDEENCDIPVLRTLREFKARHRLPVFQTLAAAAVSVRIMLPTVVRLTKGGKSPLKQLVDTEAADEFTTALKIYEADFLRLIEQDPTRGRAQRYLAPDLGSCKQLVGLCNEVVTMDTASFCSATLVEEVSMLATVDGDADKDALAKALGSVAMYGTKPGFRYTGVEQHLLGAWRVHVAGTRIIACMQPQELIEHCGSDMLQDMIAWLEQLTPETLPMGVQTFKVACVSRGTWRSCQQASCSRSWPSTRQCWDSGFAALWQTRPRTRL